MSDNWNREYGTLYTINGVPYCKYCKKELKNMQFRGYYNRDEDGYHLYTLVEPAKCPHCGEEYDTYYMKDKE